ncbi:MAG: hypothetical protein ACREC6_11520, partial [Hyphomicrobiaceae bacterium]
STLSHPIDQPHWYSMMFKVEGDDGDKIPTCGSVRWVIAQWKYKTIPKDQSSSPFLAARFDNGILHVTIQDGFCRCMIAKAEGDPDRKQALSPALPIILASQGPSDQLHPVRPLACRIAKWGPENDRPCIPDHLKLYALSAETIPSLPDPKIGWVQMTYRIRSGGAAGSRIDIYANGRFIVRAEGNIGHGVPLANTVKFKFGHYRDKIPNKAKMSVDEVCMSETAATCDPSVRLLD